MDPLPNLLPKFAAVLPDKVEMKSLCHPNSGRTCTLCHYQVPLKAAFATTSHKSQGQTMNRVIVNLNSCIGTEAAYVMVSQCMSLEGLSVLRPFPISKITTHRSQEARNEFYCLDQLRAQTTAAHCGEIWGEGEREDNRYVSDISALFSSERNMEAAEKLLTNIWHSPPDNGSCLYFSHDGDCLTNAMCPAGLNKRKMPDPVSQDMHVPKRARRQ